MKKSLLILLTCIFIIPASTQNVSIEISIHWQLEIDIVNENSYINTPYLNLKYRNNTGEDIYFKRLSLPVELNFPETGYGIISNIPISHRMLDLNEFIEVVRNSSKFADKKEYIVTIGDTLTCNGGWNILDKDDVGCEREINIINDNISDIHRYIHFKKNKKDYIPISKFQFKISDLSEDSILTINKKYFVFLKAFETYTDTFNIIAFQLINDKFTFSIQESILRNYVYIEPIWNENQNLWMQQNVTLPEKVGKYKLYNGEIYTNKIVVDFNN